MPLACAAAACAVVAAAVFSDRAAALAQGFAARLPWRTAAAGRHVADRGDAPLLATITSSWSGSCSHRLGVQAIRVVQAYCLGRALAHRRAARHRTSSSSRSCCSSCSCRSRSAGSARARSRFSISSGKRASPRHRPSRSPSSSSRSASSATCRAACSTRSTPIGLGARGRSAMKRVFAAAGIPGALDARGALARAAGLVRSSTRSLYVVAVRSRPAARHRALRPASPRGMDRRCALSATA